MGVGSSSLAQDKVHIFEEPNFQGNISSTTDPKSVHNTRQKGMSTTVGSLIVPDKCEVHLFRDNNYKGQHRYYRGPANIHRHDNSDFTSSIIIARHVTPEDEPKDRQAILYYNGRSGLEGILVEAPLEIPNVAKLGIPNNSITRVKLGPGVNLTVYDNFRYDGASTTLAGPFSGGLGDLDKKAGSFKLNLDESKNLQETSTSGSVWSSGWFWFFLIVIILLILWAVYANREAFRSGFIQGVDQTLDKTVGSFGRNIAELRR